MTCLIILSNITNIWLLAEETELQRVPENFESVEEYVRVLEPLLFEECRAQLYSTYEELQETITRDAYIMVRVKNVERRERGEHIAVICYPFLTYHHEVVYFHLLSSLADLPWHCLFAIVVLQRRNLFAASPLQKALTVELAGEIVDGGGKGRKHMPPGPHMRCLASPRLAQVPIVSV
ncbi:hypothetical protein BHE74_00014296 [Ensete ventricosum]|nr:hypothetical protein BHE74_00014296 [Ensete ventricosum]